MSIAQMLLAEFEREAVTTRRFLERLPEDRFDWQPHEKSMSAGQLALHLAQIPGYVVAAAQEDQMTIPDFNRSMPKPESLQQILDTFDQGVATVKAVLPTFNDQRMQDTWKMIKDGKEVLAVPRAGMLRNILLNHWYHHRGQFGVYLRMLGARVPSSYGPSGDEPPAFLQAS